MALEHVKRCSTSLAFGERHKYDTTRVKKTDMNKHVGEDVESLEPLYWY